MTTISMTTVDSLQGQANKSPGAGGDTSIGSALVMSLSVGLSLLFLCCVLTYLYYRGIINCRWDRSERFRSMLESGIYLPNMASSVAESRLDRPPNYFEMFQSEEGTDENGSANNNNHDVAETLFNTNPNEVNDGAGCADHVSQSGPHSAAIFHQRPTASSQGIDRVSQQRLISTSDEYSSPPPAYSGSGTDSDTSERYCNNANAVAQVKHAVTIAMRVLGNSKGTYENASMVKSFEQQVNSDQNAAAFVYSNAAGAADMARQTAQPSLLTGQREYADVAKLTRAGSDSVTNKQLERICTMREESSSSVTANPQYSNHAASENAYAEAGGPGGVTSVKPTAESLAKERHVLSVDHLATLDVAQQLNDRVKTSHQQMAASLRAQNDYQAVVKAATAQAVAAAVGAAMQRAVVSALQSTSMDTSQSQTAVAAAAAAQVANQAEFIEHVLSAAIGTQQRILEEWYSQRCGYSPISQLHRMKAQSQQPVQSSAAAPESCPDSTSSSDRRVTSGGNRRKKPKRPVNKEQDSSYTGRSSSSLSERDPATS